MISLKYTIISSEIEQILVVMKFPQQWTTQGLALKAQAAQPPTNVRTAEVEPMSVLLGTASKSKFGILGKKYGKSWNHWKIDGKFIGI